MTLHKSLKDSHILTKVKRKEYKNPRVFNIFNKIYLFQSLSSIQIIRTFAAFEEYTKE